MIRRAVEGAVDRSRLSIGIKIERTGPSICIFYDDVALWRTSAPLYDLDIYLYDPTHYREQGEDEPYTLMCVDPYGDGYTYGCWDTLEEALDWLKNPRPLY